MLDALPFLGALGVVPTVNRAYQIPCDTPNAFKFRHINLIAKACSAYSAVHSFSTSIENSMLMNSPENFFRNRLAAATVTPVSFFSSTLSPLLQNKLSNDGRNALPFVEPLP